MKWLWSKFLKNGPLITTQTQYTRTHAGRQARRTRAHTHTQPTAYLQATSRRPSARSEGLKSGRARERGTIKRRTKHSLCVTIPAVGWHFPASWDGGAAGADEQVWSGAWSLLSLHSASWSSLSQKTKSWPGCFDPTWPMPHVFAMWPCLPQ
jgi:hypothetical protein